MLTLKQILNEVLGQSAFLQKAGFASSTDPDDLQMVSMANKAVARIVDYYPWQALRRSTTLTMVDAQLAYDLPDDFFFLLPDTAWKQMNARPIMVPTPDITWAYQKAGNPTVNGSYHAKIINHQLVFVAVTAGEVINLDYQSMEVITGQGNVPKSRFTADSDVWNLDDEVLILGTKAFWKAEKEIATAMIDKREFERRLNSAITKDTGAKNIRSDRNDTPYTPPLSSQYQW